MTHQGKAASSSRVDGRAAEKLKGACGVLLKAIPPGGAAFHAEVDALLAREEHWMEWKAAGCTPFEKTPYMGRVSDTVAPHIHAPPHSSHLPLLLRRYEAKHEGKRDAKRKGGEGGGAPKPKRIQVGTSELSRLWNLGGNSLEEIAAGAAAKQSVPGLVEYLQPVLEQMDPAEGIEEEYGTRLGRGASHPRAHRHSSHLPLSSPSAGTRCATTRRTHGRPCG